MSNQVDNQQFNEQEEQENSRVDAIAITGMVIVAVVLAVFFVSR